MIKAGLLIVLGLATSAVAHATPRPSMIQVGAGAIFNDGPIEALIRINGQGGEDRGFGEHLVWARISGDFSAGKDGVGYVDMQFDTIAFDSVEDIGWGFSLFQLDMQRNVKVDNGMQLKFALLALRGQAGGEIAPSVKMYIKAALDLLAIGYSRRHSDGAESVGWGQGLSAEVGVNIHDRVRIAIGEKLNLNLNKPFRTGSRTVCDDYGCDREAIVNYQDVRLTSNTYLSIVADITENFGAFAQGGFNVYSVRDNTGETAESINSAFSLLFGVSGRY